eukprot:CAMPEP_0182867184 /NCGR_PEP_ID=MMETSP0034_2-20130328/8585_1 /TAXON_ID=156128 /ORGANISM="Nephroselmis pyriformis, Strain CCMP717" /LENGTH=67 /DNA_ID=CAMNT_0024999523 /DNA_START=196 /DNA_END=400 /DNA_ORIENTATION=-
MPGLRILQLFGFNVCNRLQLPFNITQWHHAACAGPVLAAEGATSQALRGMGDLSPADQAAVRQSLPA